VLWETENRMAWKEHQNRGEERELVYEVSWIRELGVWAAVSRFATEGEKLKPSCDA
jgi:hypothetical protein